MNVDKSPMEANPLYDQKVVTVDIDDGKAQDVREKLQRWRLTDVTPEEKARRQELLIKSLKRKRNLSLVLAGASFIIGVQIWSSLIQPQTPKLQHAFKASGFEKGKYDTYYYNPAAAFYQYQNLSLLESVEVPTSISQGLPCGRSSNQDWPSCLQPCIDKAQCGVELTTKLNCFPTCPEIQFSQNSDSRFTMSIYDVKTDQVYKQTAAIRAAFASWEDNPDIKANGGYASVWEEACDQPLDEPLLSIAMFLITCGTTTFTLNFIKFTNKLSEAKGGRGKFCAYRPDAKIPALIALRSYRALQIGVTISALVLLMNIFDSETCVKMQPELYEMALTYAGLMMLFIAIYILTFICIHKGPTRRALIGLRKGNKGASNRGPRYQLARMGVAVAGPIFFFTPFYEISWFLNHSICRIKDAPREQFASCCQAIVVPFILAMCLSAIGTLASATRSRQRFRLIKLYAIYKWVSWFHLVLCVPYVFVFFQSFIRVDFTENYLMSYRNTYCELASDPSVPSAGGQVYGLGVDGTGFPTPPCDAGLRCEQDPKYVPQIRLPVPNEEGEIYWRCDTTGDCLSPRCTKAISVDPLSQIPHKGDPTQGGRTGAVANTTARMCAEDSYASSSGLEFLVRPQTDFPDSPYYAVGTCLARGIQPWDFTSTCGKVAYNNYVDQMQQLHSDGSYANLTRFKLGTFSSCFSCRLCALTDSCKDSASDVYTQDQEYVVQAGMVMLIVAFTSAMTSVLARSIVKVIKEENKMLENSARENFRALLKNTVGCRPFEIRWRSQSPAVNLPFMWGESDELYIWKQHFKLMYPEHTTCWRSAVVSTPEWMQFTIFQTQEQQDLERRKIFAEYVESCCRYATLDATPEWKGHVNDPSILEKIQHRKNRELTKRWRLVAELQKQHDHS